MKLFRISSIYILKATLAFTALLVSFVIFYWFNNRMPWLEAKLLWPQKNFAESAFKDGGTQERASMAADLIEKKKYIGTACRKIPELLGPPTGDYYHQDGNYTYRLSERESANWILTFICDNDGTVGNIFIRKSCCSISQKILDFVLLDVIEPIVIPILKNREPPTHGL